MSESVGMKGLYDRFYGWPSGFVHGNWAAVRETAYGTCMNPLHRLHRIPLRVTRVHNDVVADAVELVDHVFESLAKAYPGFVLRLSA